MSMKLHIKNGRVVDPANKIDAVQDVYVADGRIAAIGAAPAGFAEDLPLDGQFAPERSPGKP